MLSLDLNGVLDLEVDSVMFAFLIIQPFQLRMGVANFCNPFSGLDLILDF